MRTEPKADHNRWLTDFETGACFTDAGLALHLDTLRDRAALSLPAIAGPVLGRLMQAADGLSYRSAVHEAGKPEARVYQEFGYCGAVPGGHPVFLLASWLESRIQRSLTLLSNPPLAPDFTINDVVCQRYEPGDLGITPHRDHIAYTGLIILLVLGGRGRYYVCADRSGNRREEMPSAPGTAILMPGPGYAGRSDRPFHMVGDIRARRISVGLRHDVRKEN